MQVQCKGSGKQMSAGLNATRALCPNCSTTKDLTNTGRLKKHMRFVTKRQLRRM
jgi:hypothetical protein